MSYPLAMDHQPHTKALCEHLTLYVLGLLDAEETDQVEVGLRGGKRQVARELSSVNELVGLLGNMAPPTTPSPTLRQRLFDRLGLD